jgi:hypothetical protein
MSQTQGTFRGQSIRIMVDTLDFATATGNSKPDR